GDVHDVSRLHLRGELTSTPLLVEVQTVAGAQLVRDQRALQLFVLVPGHLHGHARMVLLELGGHVLPEAAQRFTGGVVPPGDAHVTVLAGSFAGSTAAACESTDSERSARHDSRPPHVPAHHRTLLLESFATAIESVIVGSA